MVLYCLMSSSSGRLEVVKILRKRKEVCGRKHLWHILKYFPGIYLEGMQKTIRAVCLWSEFITFKCRCDILPPFWFTYVKHCLNFITGESGIKIPCNIMMLASGGRGHALFSANVYTFRNVAKIFQWKYLKQISIFVKNCCLKERFIES